MKIMYEPSEQEKLLTPRAAGAIIGIAPSTLYRMIQRGQLPAYVVGSTGRRVILREILEAMRRPMIVAGGK